MAFECAPRMRWRMRSAIRHLSTGRWFVRSIDMSTSVEQMSHIWRQSSADVSCRGFRHMSGAVARCYRRKQMSDGDRCRRSWRRSLMWRDRVRCRPSFVTLDWVVMRGCERCHDFCFICPPVEQDFVTMISGDKILNNKWNGLINISG